MAFNTGSARAACPAQTTKATTTAKATKAASAPRLYLQMEERLMYEVGQVVERRMTVGAPRHVKHIKELRWMSSNNGLVWYSRAAMVKKVKDTKAGTLFTKVSGYKADLYVVERNGESWVQTEPDETKVDNLLYLPEE